MGGARGQQRLEVREVVVHREPADPRPTGDLDDCGPGDALLLVQVGGGARDPVPGLALALGAGLELVLLLEISVDMMFTDASMLDHFALQYVHRKVRPCTTTHHQPPPHADLATRISGRVVTDADPDWDAVRQVFNLTTDLRPAAIVLPWDADDVVDRGRATPAHAGLKVAAQATGHNAAALGSLPDTSARSTCASCASIAIDAEHGGSASAPACAGRT